MSIFALTQKEWTRGSNQVRLSDLSSKQLAAAMSNMGLWSSASDLLAIGGEYAACLRKVSTTIFLTPCTASPNMCSRKRSFYLRRLSVLKPFTGARGPRMCRGRTRPPPRQFMTLGPIVSVCVCACPDYGVESSQKLPVSDEYGWQPLEEQAGTAAWSSHLGLTHS